MIQAASGRVAGRKAVVTGAAAGIGRSIAIRLAEEGADVAVLDIDGDALQGTVAQIAATGGRATAHVADVTDEKTVARVFPELAERMGVIDILVNNVGNGRCGHIWEATFEDWENVMRQNLHSAFLCTRAVIPKMIERRSGRIVMISSGSRNGTPWTSYYVGNSAYAAAKAGIHGFIRGVSLEVAEFGVTINAVAPGPIRTDRLGPVFEKMNELEYGPQKMVPMRRLGEPVEIANAVLFLASDEASYITGTTVDVTGGR